MTITPFGRDVLPLVNCKNPRSSGTTSTVGADASPARSPTVTIERSVSTRAKIGIDVQGFVASVVMSMVALRRLSRCARRCVVIPVDVLEAELRIDGDGHDARQDRAQEREHELVAVGNDQREPIALPQAEAREARRAPLGLDGDLVERDEPLGPLGAHEDEATLAIPGEVAHGVGERRWDGGERHEDCAGSTSAALSVQGFGRTPARSATPGSARQFAPSTRDAPARAAPRYQAVLRESIDSRRVPAPSRCSHVQRRLNSPRASRVRDGRGRRQLDRARQGGVLSGPRSWSHRDFAGRLVRRVRPRAAARGARSGASNPAATT